MYRIWSNKHGMWWKPDRLGYTADIEQAGIYSPEEAAAIVEQSMGNGPARCSEMRPVQ